MRTETEIRALLDKLEQFNEATANQLKRLGTNAEEFDNLAFAFNENARTISALQWVLGADTIQVNPK